MCDEFAKIMHDEFEMSMMGELNFFLGLQIKQMEDGIFFNQSKYIKEMLKKFGLEDSKPMKTPMSSDTKLTKDEELSAFVLASKRLPKPLTLKWLSVSSDTLKALRTKQTALAISTTEAEYVSARKACQQALWMKQALIDYDEIMPRKSSEDHKNTREYIPMISHEYRTPIKEKLKDLESRYIHEGRVVFDNFADLNYVQSLFHFAEFECLLEINEQICLRFILEFYSQYRVNYSDEGQMFVEFVIQNQLFSFSLEEFAQILDIPYEGCVENPELENESYVLYDRIMTPFAAQLERKPRSDHGTRRGRHSTSYSSTFDQPSSSHLNDDDDDGNDEGTSRASTPSPIRYVNSLTNQVPQVFQNPPNIDPHLEPFYTRQTEIINRQVQLRDEQRGGVRSIGKSLRRLWRNMKK
ncbi:retrovirus-related pol polyprotein from transposon TNT 1-94 [Tanacetum coccineum]|uniref:Retrovirus-related pol polyprotein from transposon TNT 1-94 n=1 Tax=Tanacetum coccineum TaxID=301880 RepID=A0ABQ5H6P7_9ASTR